MSSSPLSTSASSPPTTPTKTSTSSTASDRKQSVLLPGRKEVKDFMIGRVLGEGAYARVFIVRAKDTGKDFAMKVMEKRFIVKEGKSREVQMERRVLSDVSHPNIVRLFFSFHDKDRLYMILDLCPGGELAKLVRYTRDHNADDGIPNRALSEDQSRFYLAETISAVQHLHSIGILHRDIKPENVLISSSGHVKLTDFGTAKDLKAPQQMDEHGRPRKDTFCGTAEYVSPEVLQDEPADIGADLWALGIMLHAMLVGKTPFLSESEFLTFQCILNYAGIHDKETDALLLSSNEDDNAIVLPKKTPETLAFPESREDLSAEALDLVKQLLNPTPKTRLGCIKPDDLRAHAWFKQMDFAALDKLEPPKLPYSTEYDTPSLDGAGQDWLVSDEGGDNDDDEEELMLRMSRGSPSKKAASSPRPQSQQSQPASGLDKYLHADEKILLDGAVSMASYGGFVNSRRHMVLTNKGRIILIDPVSFTVKDEMTAINATVTVKSNGKDFDVVTPKRTLRLKDLLGSAERWKEAIAKV